MNPYTSASKNTLYFSLFASINTDLSVCTGENYTIPNYEKQSHVLRPQC